MGGITMIGAVIAASLLGCMGFRLERVIGFIRITTVTLITTLFIIAFYYHSPTFMEMIMQANTFKALQKLLLSPKLLFRMMAGGAGIALAILLQLKFPRLGNSISTFLLFAFATGLLFITSNRTYTLSMILFIMSIVGGGALLLRLYKRALFSIWTTALTGGIIVALLFAQFYYLPGWLFVILALIFSSTGLLIQRSAWKKTLSKEEIL